MSYYQYIPELDHSVESYWNSRGELTVYDFQIPVLENDSSKFPEGSFLELLFSQVFNRNDYNYRLKEVPITTFSKHIRERLQSSSSLIKCYISTDSTNDINIFSLESDDFVMLDKLLNYRKDIEITLDDVDYDVLNTTLSKLIYIYLDIMVFNEYDAFNTLETLSTEDILLENLFETYVVNEAYKSMKNWSFVIDANLLELRLVHDAIVLTEDMITDEQAPMSTPTYDLDIWVWWNDRKLVYEEEYDLYRIWDGDCGCFFTKVGWHGKNLDIKEGDTIVMEYYVDIEPGDEEKTPYIDSVPYEEVMSWMIDGGLF